MKWFSITDKLPKHGDKVLAVTNKLDIVVVFFVSNDELIKKLKDNGISPKLTPKGGYSFASQETPGNVLNGVTHWAPLPNLPK